MKNPKEFVYINEKKTFFMENELVCSSGTDGNEPLCFYNYDFSRFKFVIINEDKQSAWANIPVTEIPGIIEDINARNIIKKMSEKMSASAPAASGKSSPGTGPAYTVAITSGKLAGKTPAAALLENADVNMQFLVNQRTWLQKNLARYPKNQAQIDAITEALTLFENGQLSDANGSVVSSASNNIVYSSGVRPLIRRKMRDGKNFIYEITIKWNENLEKPVEIDIKNYYAPVVKTDASLLNVKPGKQDEVHNTFSMTFSKWKWVAHMIEANMRTFEEIVAPGCYTTANNEAKKNAVAARKAANG